MQKGLIVYTNSVISDEWPKMEEGQDSELSAKALANLEKIIFALMDYPFSGEFSISSLPFQEEILHQPTWTLNKGL